MMYSVRRIAASSLRQGSTFRSQQQQQLQQQQHQLQWNVKATRCKSTKATPTPPPTPIPSAAAAEKVAEQSSNNNNKIPIVHCFVAAAAGIGIVSATAAAVETTTADSCPVFDPKGERFDPSTFMGRFSRMLLACDPKLLLYSEDQVVQSQKMVEGWPQWFDGTPEMNRKLWEAKRMVDAAVHPDTQETIPRPFRMSGYITYNGPVCVALLASQSTLPLLAWAWINQSQNALVNYHNRNASCPMSNETLAKSYAAAVGSAIIVAFGLATVIQKKFDAAKAKSLLRWVAFPSAVVASSLNCYIVRSPEIDSGIPLMDSDGTLILNGEETSPIAATRGVHSTTLSRALLQAPVYFLPPLLVSMGPIQSLIAKHPKLAIPAVTLITLTSFGIGLPASTALFPQISPIDAADVEEKFQHLKHPKTNQPYETFYYNKGL